MTVTEFTKMVTDNSKTGQWLSCTAPVQFDNKTFNVGIKAFGLWVQRLEVNGMTATVPEQTSRASLTVLLITELSDMLFQLRDKE
jgi:hypothetical protein